MHTHRPWKQMEAVVRMEKKNNPSPRALLEWHLYLVVVGEVKHL